MATPNKQDTDDPAPVAVFFVPYATLLVAPLFLWLGWHWLAIATGLLGASVTLLFFGSRGCVKLPLFLWNALIVAVGLTLVLHNLRDSYITRNGLLPE
jgi:hypothetical protein